MNARRSEFAFALGVLWLVLVSVLCLAPMPDDGVSLPYADKLVHMLLFALGGLSIALLPLQLNQHLIGLLLLIALGGLIEGLQSHTGLRHAQWSDFAADTLGAVLGLWLTGRVLSAMGTNAETHDPAG